MDFDSFFAGPSQIVVRAPSAKGMNPPADDLSVLLADAHSRLRASHRPGYPTVPLPSVEATKTLLSDDSDRTARDVSPPIAIPANQPRNEREDSSKKRKWIQDDSEDAGNPSQKLRVESSDTSAEISESSGSLPWRKILCSLVNARPEVEDAILIQGIESVGNVLREVADANQPSPSPEPLPMTYEVLHRVCCDANPQRYYTLDTSPPFPKGESHLASQNRVTNLDLYLERHQHASFVVFREYLCCSGKVRLPGDVTPEHQTEKLVIMSENLLRSLQKVKSMSEYGTMQYVDLKLRVEIEHPHLWTYDEMDKIEAVLGNLEKKEDIEHLELFLKYFRDDKREEHSELEALLSEDQITAKFIEYLYLPGRSLLSRDIRGIQFESATKQKTWPEFRYSWGKRRPKKGENLDKEPDSVCKVTTKFRSSHWDFDGNFQEVEREASFTQTFVEGKTIEIQTFPLYPLSHAEAGTEPALRARGREFWKCRKERYVEYSGLDFDGVRHQPGTRFMIDIERFKATAPKSHLNNLNLQDGLPAGAMESDVPPEGDFVLFLPAFLMGFHMTEKRWKLLLVSNIGDVVWDQSVFNTLVLPSDTKDLIMALVTNKIAADQSTDFFSGKGTGLVVLLHGPPGTGKTLTAESVAELAKKPLYRVTCGDIGTKPEEVEKYLKQVLWLGKTWDCVVLLDEAEVFLQERALNDIQRNALVSIFLRTLEYYDGILVLTSNRVGTFDEGFKSRIQLAIHYKELTSASRVKVWENFIKRLESFETEDIDTRDLQRHVKELAEFKMNGRQIRNVVTTGRQLAMFKKKSLDFDCMRHVINVTGEFDKYLDTVNEGMDAEELAREDRLR